MIGTTLAHYRITAALGAGGMGEVWRAKDEKLGREVALKVLSEEFAGDADRLERFEREARAVASLNNPHIVTIHSVEEVEGVRFLTMELIEGESLDRLIPEGGMPIEQLIEIASGLAEALAAAHDKGIVHRDLKPANVMVTNDGWVKVLDFGLAKLAGLHSNKSLDSQMETDLHTREGVVMGTVPYMSPEQLEGRAVDHRSDIFSFGVVLYEMATGVRPFQSETTVGLMTAILRDAPKSVTVVREDFPGAFARVIEWCLAKAPGDRPEHVHDVQRQLDSQRADEVSRDSRQTSPSLRDCLVGNLPTSVDSFVARDSELAEIGTILADARLVTLVGVGGTGKTRLAIETAKRVAAGFADGTWLVELAPVTQAEAVHHVVADLIGAVQQPGKTITQSVVDSLRYRTLLLVLDNCEHVLDAVADLAGEITTKCDGVRILATSRENLAIRGERVVRLQSLADEDGAILFRDRARAAGAVAEFDMEILASLSRRLDGMPLAIELAAAHCGSMNPEEIERRLDDRFRLLRGSRRGRMERHQTLRNTVAWSYDLLEPVERRVFDRLSAFAGGFTREAAVAVAGGDDVGSLEVEDAIESLVARSMVLASITGDGTRYRLLETLRQFGEEQLVASGDAAKIHDRHMRFFTEFMDRAWSGLWSDDDPPWIRAIGREYENLRVAVYAAIENADREALAALLKPHIWWAWHALRYEVADWAEAALAVEPEPKLVRCVAVHLLTHGGRPDDAVRLAEGLAESIDDSDAENVCLWAWAHFNRSIITEDRESSRWMNRWTEAGRRLENKARRAAVTSIEVAFKMMAGKTDEALRIAVESHDLACESGNRTALCWTTFFMGRAHSMTQPQEALGYFERAAEIAEECKLPLIGGIASTEAAMVIARVEEPSKAWPRLAAALRSFVESGDRRQLWTSSHHLAYLLWRFGRRDDAVRLWNELGCRPAYTARHHRDELEELLGEPGEGTLSDDELVEHIRGVLDDLDGDAA